MATTYLTLVNDVLTRLREATVSSVDQNTYSALIGKLINDSKREVEDAWSWEVLRNDVTISTVSGTSEYSITGSGDKSRILLAYNSNQSVFMEQRPTAFFVENLNFVSSPQTGAPMYYGLSGIDGSGDIKVKVFPKPDAVYSLTFNLFTPEAELSADTDTTNLPKDVITSLAWAKAIEERGEDGGVTVSSQYAVAKQALVDRIAIEAGRRPEETTWNWS